MLEREAVDVSRGGKIASAWLKRHAEFSEWLMCFQTGNAEVFSNVSQVLCWLKNPIRITRCAVCGKRLSYSKVRERGCSMFCSMACMNTERGQALRNERSRNAVLEKSGGEFVNNFQVNKREVLKRAKETRFKNALSSVKCELEKCGLEILNIDGLSSFYDEDGRRYKFDIRCKSCGVVFKHEIRRGYNFSTLCPKCNRKHLSWSAGEKEVAEFVRSLGVEVVENDRTLVAGFEIDIVSHERKIAIEYDGLYWHSEENGKDRNYHLIKTLNCAERGYRLIHIFEDEWRFKRGIVEDRLRHLFGASERRVFARKCRVAEIGNGECERFVNENHLQGSINASCKLGLYDGDALVAVMTFGKPRYNKEFDWELLRYCCLRGCCVVGGAGKLLSHFLRLHKGVSIISYADKRWSDGGLYRSLGMQRLPDSLPSASYFHKDRLQRENYMRFQRHKLSVYLDEYDEKLSAKENIRKNGYYKIWDCGNYVFCLGLRRS